jgi:hypothetical protein
MRIADPEYKEELEKAIIERFGSYVYQPGKVPILIQTKKRK